MIWIVGWDMIHVTLILAYSVLVYGVIGELEIFFCMGNEQIHIFQVLSGGQETFISDLYLFPWFDLSS